jgi:hypothetical protein
MTGVEAVRKTCVVRAGARTVERASAAFAMPEEDTVPSTAVTDTMPSAALASMLTLQEVGDEAPEDRRARRYGHDLLDALAALRGTVLIGCDDTAILRHVASLAVSVPPAADAGLAAIVSAIVVRARVELARRQL